MRNVATVTSREIGAYFLSPIAYAVIAVFLFGTGMAFGLGSFANGAEASMRSVFDTWMLLILVFVLPMLTMRSISDELRTGTIETLMTAPITETDIVLGKFLGAFTFFLVMLVAIFLYPLLLSMYGSLDLKLLTCNYIGLILLGSLYIAVGLFFSACTKHQVIAVLVSFALLALMTFASFALAERFDGWPRVVLQQLSVRTHFAEFVRGMIDINHVVFFLTTTGFFLFLAVKRLEMRRW